MAAAHTKTRVALLSIGLATLLTGAALFAASFAYPAAYLRNNPLALAWSQTTGPPNHPLIYPGYEADLEESSIHLMNLGTWTAFAGLALVILSRAKSRPSKPTPEA